MRTVGYDVVAIGERELNYGLDFLLEEVKQGKLNVVCANLYKGSDSTLLFKPYLMKEVEGVRIGFLGLLDNDPRRVGVFEELENLYVTNYVEAVRKYLPELQSKADLIIALAHIGLANARELAKQVPELDVILVGHGGDRTSMPQKVGETIVMKPGSKSSSIGTMVLALDDHNNIIAFDGTTHTLKKKGRINEKVDRYVTSCEEREKQRERLLAKRKYRFPTIPRRREVLAANGYLGWETCKACHPGIYERWLELPHAQAFATLAKDDRWNDPACLPCHTTGYEIEAKRDSTDVRPEMWNVQCEACHGMGTKHRRDGSMPLVPESVCRRCHTPKWSPNWNYEDALKKIDHGKDEVTD